MQRLFSTFPNAWPGFGLLIVRLSLAFPLVFMAYEHGLVLQPLPRIAQQLLTLALAGCLVSGIATPYAAALQVAVSMWAGCVDHGASWLYWSLAGASAETRHDWTRSVVDRRADLRSKAH